MNDRELILKFLSDNLNQKGKNKFEEKIKSNPLFREKFENINAGLIDLKNSNHVKVDESYFINLVPLFRHNSEKKKFNSFKPVFSLIGTAAIAILVVLFAERNSNDLQNGNKISVNELTEQEINYLSDISPDEFSNDKSATQLDDDLSNILAGELEINDEEIVSLYDDFEIISTSISDEEAEKIYAELIDKNIFQ